MQEKKKQWLSDVALNVFVSVVAWSLQRSSHFGIWHRMCCRYTLSHNKLTSKWMPPQLKSCLHLDLIAENVDLCEQLFACNIREFSTRTSIWHLCRLERRIVCELREYVNLARDWFFFCLIRLMVDMNFSKCFNSNIVEMLINLFFGLLS